MQNSPQAPQVKNWKPDFLPDLSGKTYVITGGNSGIGYEAARLLGERGALIVIAARSPKKAASAREGLLKEGVADVELVTLDLSSLMSVREAATDVGGRFSRIDGLINNAGIMQTPETRTVDGYELQLATNHLGHFLWTAILIDRVEAAAGRVVTVSSLAHKFGRMNFDDLMQEKDYSPSRAYGQSKLANLMFALELDRRLQATGAKTASVACHPGYSSTNLQSTGPTGFLNTLYKITNVLIAQSAEAGAYPTVLAAAGREALPGGFYGPTAMGGARGPVGDADISAHALDREAWAKLWAASEELVGQKFPVPSA